MIKKLYVESHSSLYIDIFSNNVDHTFWKYIIEKVVFLDVFINDLMELLFETNIVNFRIDDRILVTIDVLQTLGKISKYFKSGDLEQNS